MNRDCKNFKSEILLNNFKQTLFDISKIKDNESGSFSGRVSSTVLNGAEILQTTFAIDNFSTTNHELLHLSTLSGLITGFKNQTRSNEVIGVGINEGYTQFLSERYFNENVGESYLFETLFSNILENIIGKDKMEKYYFQMSLSSLINELEKYETYENIIKFIKNMDYLANNGIDKNENPTLEEINKYQNIINQICEFLLSCSKSKVDVVLEENPDIEFREYADTLLFNMFYNESTTYFHKSENIKEYTTKLFDENKVLELYEYADQQYGKNKKR